MRIAACLTALMIAAVFTLCAWMAGISAIQSAHAQIPESAHQWQRPIIREAQARFGVNAPVARIAGQLHQESSWRAEVCSWAGACGLAQFMPATSDWMAELFPSRLAPADPFNPYWSIKANVYFNYWLYERNRNWADECSRWAGVLSGYNGGLGWVNRDRRLAASSGADPNVWVGHVEFYSNRAQWAIEENRAYVHRILHVLEPRYLNAGWPGEPVC